MAISTIRKLQGLVAMAVAVTSSVPAAAQSESRVRIGDFAIDRTEVTIAQFRAFTDETTLETEAHRKGGSFEFEAGWKMRPGWTFERPFGSDPLSQHEPAAHVTWSEAVEYCRWRDGRLPSSQEWTLAAYTEMREGSVGFEAGRRYNYPVGDTPDGMNLRGDDPWPRHVAVGTTEPGVNGLSDMGGNVWEWLADRQGDTALTAGGSWWYGPEQTAANGMQWKPFDFHAVYVGFRCVYDVN